MEIEKTKAFSMLSKVKTVKERANKYAERIKKGLHLKVLASLEERIEKVNDTIFDLSNFSLETDKNKDMTQLSKEDCEKRFERIIQLEYERKLLELEYETKKKTFIDLFGDL